MLKDALVPELERVFGVASFRRGNADYIIAVFPAVHPEVGDVEICQANRGAWVSIGRLSHVHFDLDMCFESEQEIVEAIVEFLKDLFSNRELIWVEGRGSPSSSMIESVPEGKQPRDFATRKGIYYLWSGPLAEND